VAEQVLRAAELEQLDASRIQIVDTAIEIEDLDAIIASLDEMTPELLERWRVPRSLAQLTGGRDDSVEDGDEALFVERLAERWYISGEVIAQEPIAIARNEHERENTTGGSHLFA
jgi:hypothetical protein